MVSSRSKAAIATGDGGAQWREALIAEMFRRMHTFEQNNFDAVRYAGVPPNAFFADLHSAYFSFLMEHWDEFYRARSLLEDQSSKQLFDQLLLFRILGHLHIRLPYNNAETNGFNEIAEAWKVETTQDQTMFGPLEIYSVPSQGGVLKFKCWKANIVATILSRQYHFQRNGVTVDIRPGDHVIDAGGCFGDTALAFAEEVGDRGHVYTFDPLPKHCRIIREAIAMNARVAARISIFETGLADRDRTAFSIDSRSEMIDPGARIADDLPTRALDSMLLEEAIPRVDFIKMDIEGSELAALRGAEQCLRENRPRLAISLYHRREDFFAIPLWLESLDCGYRMFLEHYSIHHEETVLYAISDRAR
jgi:FkbM family methyltransferase